MTGPWLRLTVLGLLFGIVATVSSDVFARMYVSHELLSIAVSQAIHYKVIQPIGAIFLVLPFVGTACVAAAFSRNGKTMRGYCIFACSAFLLFILYVWGYCGSQHALQQHAWTAAALSEGLLPIFSIPVVAVGVLLGLLASAILSSLPGRATETPP